MVSHRDRTPPRSLPVGEDFALHSGAELAATVVLTRDGDEGIEVLMVRRNDALATHGGAWAFPGGRAEADDITSEDNVQNACRAGIREVEEETGISLERSDLGVFARWLTPLRRPRRFDAYFFHGHVGRDTIAIADGGEIVETEWVRPARALADQLCGRRLLPGPTAITLRELATFATSSRASATLRHRPLREFVPHTVWDDDHVEIHLYRGDAGFLTKSHAAEGPRHRMIRAADGLRYEWSFEETRIAVPRFMSIVPADAAGSPAIAWEDGGRRFVLENGSNAWPLLDRPAPPEPPRDPLLLAAELAEVPLDGMATVDDLVRSLEGWTP